MTWNEETRGTDVQGRRSPDGVSASIAWWWAAAAVVLLVVLGGAWVVWGKPSPSASSGPRASSASGSGSTSVPVGGDPSDPSAATLSTGSSSTPVQPATQVSAGWPDSGCNGTAGRVDAAPQSVMTDLRWTPFLSAAVPTSPILGPTRVDGALRRCYQHSPAGALVAAANISLAQYDPTQGRAVVEGQFLAGPGRDKALRDLAGSTGTPGQVVAFRLNGCTPSACNVDLVFFGQGMYAAAVVPMAWSGGDWVVDGTRVLPDGGLVQGIPAGFTAWGAS